MEATQLELIQREEKAFQKFAALRLSNDDKISIPKIYYDITEDHAAAAVLDEILFWTLPNKKTGRTALRVRKEGILWLAVSRTEWWDRKRLTERQADRGINRLIEMGLVEKSIHRFNGHAQMHLRVKAKEFFDMYGKALQKIYLEDGTEENDIRDIADLYEMMGMSDSPNRELRNGDSDSPNGDSDSPNRNTINSLQPSSIQSLSRPLSEKDLKFVNKKVDAILENDRKSQSSWIGRESIPEPIRPLLDEYVVVTGQKPSKNMLLDWLQSGQEWLELGVSVGDVRAAYKKAKPENGSGFSVTRPGSLTRTIGEICGERRRKTSSTPVDAEARARATLAALPHN